MSGQLNDPGHHSLGSTRHHRPFWSADGSANVFDDLQEFHQKFGFAHHYAEGPHLLDPELTEFRVKFMQEELDEYREAVQEGDLAKAMDALLDLIYVAGGTGYLHGFPMAEGWRRVQEANMSKVRAQSADESKRGTAHDVVKPEGWQAPNHDDLVV